MKEWHSSSWQLADGDWGQMDKRVLDKEGNFSRWKTPLTPPPYIHFMHTYTHMAKENDYEEVPIRPSSSGQALLHSSPVLLCSFSMFCLYPSITPLSLPLPAPSHKILDWTTKCTVSLTFFKPVSRSRKSYLVARWLLGATGVMMWIISLFGLIMRAVRRKTQTHLHQFEWRRLV